MMVSRKVCTSPKAGDRAGERHQVREARKGDAVEHIAIAKRMNASARNGSRRKQRMQRRHYPGNA